MSDLRDRVRGALLGGLCGDAIGRPAECLSYQEIAARFGRITGPLEQPGRQAGDGTDDSALKHMLCEAILRAPDEVTPADWAAVWRERMRPDGFWTPVQNAYYRLMVQHIPPEEVGVGTMVSNSSAMCIAPIGIVNAGNPAAACREALSAARLIHRGFPLEAAGAVAAAVAEALRRSATPDTVLAAAVAHLPAGSEMVAAIEAAAALARACTGYEEFRERFYTTLLRPWPHRRDGWSIAVDPRETVPAALGVFLIAGGDPQHTILGCANFGRDADTIATIGGALAGALTGAAAIPAAWIEAVCAASPVDQDALAAGLLGVLRRRAERAAAWSAGVLELFEERDAA
ncbi:MAG TPA: ADP-ribosylglycohydrolase family protein [Roseiflexaceae bacterium]|nr:ADP-ribosylglycohydrolase family protein [Roseiflexaceae bacterium]